MAGRLLSVLSAANRIHGKFSSTCLSRELDTVYVYVTCDGDDDGDGGDDDYALVK